MPTSGTLWQTGTWLHYNYTNADVLQNMVSEKRIKTSKSLFNDALSPLQPFCATQLCLYHSLQSNAQAHFSWSFWYSVPNPANYVGQRMTMTRNGSNHLHTRICRFWAGWILADIKYTTCPIQQIYSVRSLEKRRWRDSWLELSMSQKRLGNLKTWWMCALCTRSLGRRGLLSGNFSSKYCKAFPPTFSIRQHHKVKSSERNWLLHK
jgi:hypothetical protein